MEEWILFILLFFVIMLVKVLIFMIICEKIKECLFGKKVYVNMLTLLKRFLNNFGIILKSDRFYVYFYIVKYK